MPSARGNHVAMVFAAEQRLRRRAAEQLLLVGRAAEVALPGYALGTELCDACWWGSHEGAQVDPEGDFKGLAWLSKELLMFLSILQMPWLPTAVHSSTSLHELRLSFFT